MSAPLPSPSPLPPWLERRPEKRSECPPPDQQCPWVSCRYHLALDVQKRHRLAKAPRVSLNLPEDPDLWPDDAPTCALHVAESGEQTLQHIGDLLRMSRERVRQIAEWGFSKLSRIGTTHDMAEVFDISTNRLQISAGIFRPITAKATPTTTPRPPSPPSNPPSETPPSVLPTKSKPDDQPEVAVVAALPDPSPAPKAKPMPPHQPRSTWAAQAAYASERLRQTLKERNLSPVTLAHRIVADLPHLDARSTEISIRKIIGSGDHASTKSITYRRCAHALGLTLDDLCDDAAWVAAIPTEDNPAVIGKQNPFTIRAPQKPAPTTPIPSPKAPAVRQVATLTPPPPVKAAPPAKVPEPEPATNALAPLLIEALKQAQAHDERAAEQATVIDLLRHECDDLRQQLAAAVKERDAATTTLATIRKSLGVA